MASPPNGPASDAPTRGILCMIVGTMLLTSNDAITKWLLQTLHPGDMMAWRGLFSMPFIVLILRYERAGLRDVRSKAPARNFLRAVLALTTSVLVIISFQVLPLADALSVIFVSPLMVTAMSALILKEEVGWRRWAATVVGFGGAMIVVGPSFSEVGYWVLAPLGAAMTAACRDIATRPLSRIDSGPSILVWTMVVGAIGGFASLPVLGATPLTWTTVGLLFVASAMLALSNRLTIAAFKLASGAVVAPLKYLALIWAAGIGYAVWGDVPEPRKVVGAAIIAAAGLYIWRREILIERERRR